MAHFELTSCNVAGGSDERQEEPWKDSRSQGRDLNSGPSVCEAGLSN
jgi:hypothetical protein